MQDISNEIISISVDLSGFRDKIATLDEQAQKIRERLITLHALTTHPELFEGNENA